jgi:SAM-dependent methyltransferase
MTFFFARFRLHSASFSMNALDQLKNDWESLAERDALHAILADATKNAGKWNLEEFMATGELEIRTVIGYLAQLDHLPNYCGEALDFGWGVGRLTQALARRFDACIGLDISHRMIKQAESLNRYVNCRYIASSDACLPFPAARFSFIYSNIVLQHTPRGIATKYLQEFVRTLAPGGVLVFGVQDSFAAPNLSSLLTRLRHILHLRSRIKAALGLVSGQMQMHCSPERIVRNALGQAKIVDIQLTNTGSKDFNGNLVYLAQPPTSGYIGKQYCVVKPAKLAGNSPGYATKSR